MPSSTFGGNMSRVDYELYKMAQVIMGLSKKDSLSTYTLENLKLFLEILELVNDDWEFDMDKLKEIYDRGNKMESEMMKFLQPQPGVIGS